MKRVLNKTRFQILKNSRMKLLNILNLKYQISYLKFLILIRYSDIINTMWVTFLYAPVIPIVLPLSLVYIILTYYIEKYTIMRRSSVKSVLSKNISIEMIEYLDFIIIFYSIGNLFNFNKQEIFYLNGKFLEHMIIRGFFNWVLE